MIEVEAGDVVRIQKLTYRGPLEVDYVDESMVAGRIPYASTYTPGGQHEGSYRGQQNAWRHEVTEVIRSTATTTQEAPA